MIEPIEWLRVLIENHRSLEYIIIFGGAALGGELALFTLGFLSAQGVLSFLPVAILSFAGSFFPNMLWYFLGKTDFMSKVVLHRYASTPASAINLAVSKLSQGNHFAALTIIKFMVGTPVMLVVYVNKTNISFRKFMYYESGTLFLSLLVILPIGFIAGLGFSYVADIFNDLYTAIGFILLFVIIVIMAQIWLRKKFTGGERGENL